MGCTIAEIDRFFPSSKRCSSCGLVHELCLVNKGIAIYQMLSCKDSDRDINTAMNIKTVGLAGLV
ncbi:transposase [Vibrio cholerae]|uniref:zinc ribbon domain-containing protein n=1 Tax=Vibrio cholerae TaxID=666 RepID=UPI001C9CFB7F|nr:transposase [Vibrio cholerae]EGR4314262.1 transposase [Vibrio cholerae]MBY8105092.1 hypothetical protein [Vibrio fluvialis]